MSAREHEPLPNDPVWWQAATGPVLFSVTFGVEVPPDELAVLLSERGDVRWSTEFALGLRSPATRLVAAPRSAFRSLRVCRADAAEASATGSAAPDPHRDES